PWRRPRRSTPRTSSTRSPAATCSGRSSSRKRRSFRSIPRMSERTRHLPRRSCLSIPGSSEKMLAKGPNIPADMTFLDLEDAVSPLEKEAARPKVVEAIKAFDWGDRVLCVRFNAWDTEWTAYDVIAVVTNAGE